MTIVCGTRVEVSYAQGFNVLGFPARVVVEGIRVPDPNRLWEITYDVRLDGCMTQQFSTKYVRPLSLLELIAEQL